MFGSKFLMVVAAAIGFAFAQAPAFAETSSDATTSGPTIAAAFDVTKPYPTDLVIGYSNAPVTIIEYASLTCPHCAHFHTTVYPTLKKDWIDTGHVKFVYRDFPLDQSAFFAAIAVSCLPVEQRPKAIASLFENQSTWPATSFEDGLDALAKKLADPAADISAAKFGVASLFKRDVDPAFDLAKARACIADTERQKRVATPALDIRKADQIKGTPAIFINGKEFTGTRSVETLGKAIQDLLATK
jgi:protein-disulfide isomerase